MLKAAQQLHTTPWDLADRSDAAEWIRVATEVPQIEATARERRKRKGGGR